MKLSAMLSRRQPCGDALFGLVIAFASLSAGAVMAGDNRTHVLNAPEGAFAAEFAAPGESGLVRTIIVYVQNADNSEQTGAQIKRFVKLFAQKARLDAERRGAADIIFPVGFELASNTAQSVAKAERRVFFAKRAADENQKDQHLQRIEQLKSEIEGLRIQKKAKANELELIRRELKLVENLYKKSLTNEVRLIGMQRDLARFEGEEGSLISQIARVEAQIQEVQLQISAIDKSTALDAEKVLRDVEAELNELIEQRAQKETAATNGQVPDRDSQEVVYISSGHFPKFDRLAPRNLTSYRPDATRYEAESSNVNVGEPGAQPKKRRGYGRLRRTKRYHYRGPGYRISRVARRILRLRL